MPYIGNTIRAADDYRLIDDISSGFNGSETSFALQVAGSAPVPFPKSPQQVLISVNGVIQEPDPTGSSGFNLVGTNIVFSSAPTNGHAFFGIIYATADYLNAGGNFPAGSLGAPSITFIGDENTGLFRKSGGSVGFVSDATEIANFDSNGITISSGNLIIPDSIIHGGDSDTKIRFSAANTVTIETGGAQRLFLGNSDTVFNETGADVNLRIESDANANCFTLDAGKSGIGINQEPATGYGLDILGNSGYDDVVRITGVGTNIGPRLNFTPTGSGVARINATNNSFQLQTGGTTALTIDTSQKVAIGTSTTNSSDRFTIVDPGDSFMSIRSDAAADNTNQILDFAFGTANRSSSNLTGIIAATIHSQSGGTLKSDLKFSTNSGNSITQKMVIKDSGRIGIGNSDPKAQLHINSDLNAETDRHDAANYHLVLRNPQDDTGQACGLGFSVTSNTNKVGASILHERDGGGSEGSMQFYTSDDGNSVTERMRITSAGLVGMGVTTVQDRLHIGHSGNTNVQIECTASGSGANAGVNVKSADGGDYIIQTGNAVSGGLRIYDAGASSERVTLKSDGKVGIGSSAPELKLHVFSGGLSGRSAANSNCNLVLEDGTSAGIQFFSANQVQLRFGDAGSTAGGSIIYDHTSDFMRFSCGSEAVRITSAGRMRVNCADMTADPSSSNVGVLIGNTGSGTVFSNGASTGFSNNLIFINGNGVVGTVTTNGSNTAYNTSSDYRLKENETAISDGITRLKTLKPYRFNFKADASTTVDGFFAHEVTAVPEAITGTKDEVATEDTVSHKKGDPIYQGIDQSKLVPLLTAALQEAVTKIETLETKVAALEAA